MTAPRHVCAALGVTLACVLPAHAQVKGDLWELTIKSQMTGLPADLPQRTSRTCMDKSAKDVPMMPQKTEEGDCRSIENKRTGNVLRYRMQCTGKDKSTLSVEGEVTYASDGSYTGRMRLAGKSGDRGYEMIQTYSGRKIGECSNPVHP